MKLKKKRRLPPGVIETKGGVMSIRGATKEDTWRMIRMLVERVNSLEAQSNNLAQGDRANTTFLGTRLHTAEKRITVLEAGTGRAAGISDDQHRVNLGVFERLNNVESDVKYACAQIKAIIDRMPKPVRQDQGFRLDNTERQNRPKSSDAELLKFVLEAKHALNTLAERLRP